MASSRESVPAEPQEFYAAALTEAERLRLSRAKEVKGLDEEIALLRVRLLKLVREHPEDFDLLLKGIALLVRAVSARYRLSPKAEDDLAASIAGVVKGIGAQLGLGDDHGAE
ncbi:MAG: hypothetical protein HY683_04300 [Chloroflexi bacterium]|nr:hypothetical protein [Chloroflexota bacterium]